jgi:hypothetical protein
MTNPSSQTPYRDNCAHHRALQSRARCLPKTQRGGHVLRGLASHDYCRILVDGGVPDAASLVVFLILRCDNRTDSTLANRLDRFSWFRSHLRFLRSHRQASPPPGCMLNCKPLDPSASSRCQLLVKRSYSYRMGCGALLGHYSVRHRASNFLPRSGDQPLSPHPRR